MDRIKKWGAWTIAYAKKFLKLARIPFLKWWELVKTPKKRWLALSMIPVVLIIAFGGWKLWSVKVIQASKTVSAQRTTEVVRGNMEITLSGSGAVAADGRAELTIEAGGKIVENHMEEGKAVKAGDVLLVLESKEAELSMKKMENTVLQKEQTYLKQQEQVSGLNLRAPFNGTVTGISYEAGDNVNNGAVLLNVADESSLIARVQFKNATAEGLKGAQSIELHIPEYSTSLPAKIQNTKHIGNDLEVALIVANPGALKSGVKVWAEITTAGGSFTSEQVELEWVRQEIFKAESTGTIDKIYINENQKVAAGTLLMTIINDSLGLEMESARLQLEEAKNNLEQAQLDLDKYKITAPFDGHLISVADLTIGDTIKAGTKAAVLIDTNQFSFTINIDELDISQVEKGQEVSVTVEALEETSDNPLKGIVTSVALEGTANNGVTSYPVTIALTGKDGLRSGMNVDGVIQVEKKENVLIVPLEAVQKRGSTYTVWVKREGSSTAPAVNEALPAEGFGGRQGRQLTPEQQQQFASMSEEERQALRQKMQEQRGTQQNGAQSNINMQSPSVINNQNNRNQTTVTGKNTAASNPYYEGAVQVRVTVGIHNETYLEILDGLSEGEIVVLPQITASTTSAQSTQNQGNNLNGAIRGLGGGTIPSMGGGGFTPRTGGQ